MKTIAFAVLVLVCCPAVFAERVDQNPGERARLASHASSEKSVLLRYDIATAAVTAVRDMPSLNNVVDMNPAHALSASYAVVVAGDGSSFIVPAPVMKRASAVFVLVPFSVKWDVQSVTVNNLPSAGAAARSFTIDGDLLLSKTDIAEANALPSLNPHKLQPRVEWCIFAQVDEMSRFDTAGGGHVCVWCISCADGSQEICANFYSC